MYYSIFEQLTLQRRVFGSHTRAAPKVKSQKRWYPSRIFGAGSFIQIEIGNLTSCVCNVFVSVVVSFALCIHL